VFVIHGTIVLGPVSQSSVTNKWLGAEKLPFPDSLPIKNEFLYRVYPQKL